MRWAVLMSLTSTLAATAALAVGSVGAVTAYQIVAPEPVAETSQQTAAAASQQQGERGFAPCRPPAELEAGKCVTEVTRTVVVPADDAPSTPAREAPVSRAQARSAHPPAALAAALEECDPDDLADRHEGEGTEHEDDCLEDAREEAADAAEEQAEEAEERAEERAERAEERAEDLAD